MRIAMIGHKRYGSREGGVEVVVTELARRMAALGHEVTCYDRGGRDVMTGEASGGERVEDGVRVVPVRTVDIKGAAALSASISATVAAIGDAPDVIHYHAEGPCVSLPFARRAGMRTVATIHGLDWRRAKWGFLARACIRRGERAAARHADELIVLSRPMRAYFQDAYGREAQLVPNGVDTAEPVPAHVIAERWGLEQGSYVLFLGRLVPEKRPELLIRAFRGQGTDKRLVIAGAPSDTSDFVASLRRAAEGDPRIVFTGFVQGDELAELYSNAYCYVLPSDVEGMPMSLLEAMSYGCCCLTSDIPECADVIADVGVTFRAGDAASLGETLASLLAGEARARSLGVAARARARATFDWDEVVRRTLELYGGAGR